MIRTIFRFPSTIDKLDSDIPTSQKSADETLKMTRAFLIGVMAAANIGGVMWPYTAHSSIPLYKYTSGPYDSFLSKKFPTSMKHLRFSSRFLHFPCCRATSKYVKCGSIVTNNLMELIYSLLAQPVVFAVLT